MDFFTFIGSIPALILHPFKSLSDLYDSFQESKLNAILTYAFAASLIGNVSLLTAGGLVQDSGHPAVRITTLLLIFYLFNLFLLAFYFFSLHLVHKAVVVRDLASFYLLPDFIYILLLPLSIILKAVLPGNTWIYSLLTMVLLLLNTLMKLKAIGLTSSLSMGKSFLLLVTPWFLCFLFIGINIFYLIFQALSAFL